MIEDRYGLALTTGSTEARDAYVAGVDGLLGALPGEVEQLERAVAADPGFALAQIALGRARFVRMELARAREAVAQARVLVQAASERERSHVHALALAIEGKPVESLAATREHLARWPRDAMVAAPATGVFGLYGFSGRPGREDELFEWLESLAPHYGDDWWFALVHAFAACETGRLDQAQRLIERSLAIEPRSGHGVHVRAHVHYELHEHRQALALLDAFLPGYDRGAVMHCHLSWHLALSALALGDAGRAWQAYDEGVHPGAAWGPPLNVVTDSASFLWRAELEGQPRDAGRWREVHEHGLRCFPRAGVTFADVHRALGCIATGDAQALQALADELRARVEAHRLPAGEVVPRLVEGIAAYGRQDWDAAIAALEPALPDVVRIGGSRAQRDLVLHTLRAALVRAGRADEAQPMPRRMAPPTPAGGNPV